MVTQLVCEWLLSWFVSGYQWLLSWLSVVAQHVRQVHEFSKELTVLEIGIIELRRMQSDLRYLFPCVHKACLAPVCVNLPSTFA